MVGEEGRRWRGWKVEQRGELEGGRTESINQRAAGGGKGREARERGDTQRKGKFKKEGEISAVLFLSRFRLLFLSHPEETKIEPSK